MNRLYFFLVAAAIAIPKPVFAHGANIEYRETPGITIQAKYDDGKPMANAQVVVYAPGDRATPWLQGRTDKTGHFSFIPDTTPENRGDWDIKVRQSGHGHITTIPISDKSTGNTDTNINNTNTEDKVTLFSGYSFSQKWIMAAAVGWGFVGTALFFSRKSS